MNSYVDESALVAPTREVRSAFFERICECPFVGASSIGKSLLGENIYCYRLGAGARTVVVVGAHHGMEHVTAAALIALVAEVGEARSLGRALSGHWLDSFFALFSLFVVPCLNPDGVDMALGHRRPSPLSERQLKMNGGADFSRWQANARGVDLNHNYDFRFAEYKRLEAAEHIAAGRTRFAGEYAESEPEAHALANLVRTLAPALFLSLHTQGEVVYHRPRKSARSRRLAARAASLLGYSVAEPEGLSNFGGASDYFGERLGVPSLTVELGRGENPLPPSVYPSIAERVRRLCLSLPYSL